MSKCLRLALIGAFGLSVTPAHAGDVAAAEALFRQGRALMDQGDYAAGCPKLRESYSQDPATGTLLALAVCLERSGLTASAWATYAAVAERAQRDGNSDREEAARERMALLEPELPRLTIDVDRQAAQLPGFQVKRDGREVGSGGWGVSLPVDPGDHVVEATATGHRPLRITVRVELASPVGKVQIPTLAPASEHSPFAETERREELDEGASTGLSPLRIAGLAVAGAGVAALGVGGYFALHARSRYADSKDDGACNAANQCNEAGGKLRDDAIEAANAATISALVGAALTGAGVALWVLAPPKRPTGIARSVQAIPVLEPSRAGVLLRGRF